MNMVNNLPHDPTLPHLATMLDPTAMARQFDEYFVSHTRGHLRVSACTVDRIKYRPGRNCTVGYRLMVEDLRARTTTTRRLYGSLHEAAEARRRYGEIDEPRGHAETALPTVGQLQAMPMLVWDFPQDRKLHSLPLLIDVGAMKTRAHALLIENVVSRCDDSGPIQHDVVSYFPEHSCTVRMRGVYSNNTHQHPWYIYAKARSDTVGAQTYRVMQAIDNAIADTDTVLGFAPVLDYQSDARILWQNGIDAPTLAALIDAQQCDGDTLRRLAHGLAAFHETAIELDHSATRAALIAQLDDAARLIRLAAPHCASALDATVTALVARAEDIDPTLNATVHGDLHTNNVLVSPEKIYLIDLDRVARGMALAELGSLLAELATRAHVRDEQPNVPMMRALVDAYAHASHRQYAVHDVAWHFAAALIYERAKRCVTSLKPRRMAALPRLIETAQWALGNPWALSNGMKPMSVRA